jgi:hypothetical protein
LFSAHQFGHNKQQQRRSQPKRCDRCWRCRSARKVSPVTSRWVPQGMPNAPGQTAGSGSLSAATRCTGSAALPTWRRRSNRFYDPIGTGPAFGVPVQCPHHADAREHRRATKFGYQDQAFHCCLPFWRLMLGLRQFCDVTPGVLERGDLAPERQGYRIVKGPFPIPPLA